MKQTITIEIPEGKVAKQIINENGNIALTFVDKEPIRSKSWAEFCRNHPNVKYELFINQHGGIDFRTNEPRLSNNLETKEDAEGILALIQLTRLHDEWVDDWKGNYNEQNGTLKYQIVCSENKPCVSWHHTEYSLLDFPNEKMAAEFLQCFHDLINKAKRFI